MILEKLDMYLKKLARPLHLHIHKNKVQMKAKCKMHIYKSIRGK